MKTPVTLKTWATVGQGTSAVTPRFDGSDKVSVLALSIVFCSGASSMAWPGVGREEFDAAGPPPFQSEI